MKYIFGNTLSIGDTVAFNRPTYRDLSIGRISAFTAQKVRFNF